MSKKSIAKKKKFFLLFLTFWSFFLLSVFSYYYLNQRGLNLDASLKAIKEKQKEFNSTEKILKLVEENKLRDKKLRRQISLFSESDLPTSYKKTIQKFLDKSKNAKNPLEASIILDNIYKKIFTRKIIEKQIHKQNEFQKNIFDQVAPEAKEKIDNILKYFFHLCLGKLSKEEIQKKDWKDFSISVIKGKDKTSGWEESDFAFCQKLFGLEIKGIDFSGFGGFLKKNESTGKENSMTLGLTISKEGKNHLKPLWKGGNIVSFKKFEKNGRKWKIPEFFKGDLTLINLNNRLIEIKLEKKFLLNREGPYEEWIEEKDQKLNTIDISWEKFQNTVAHELAHAIIDAMIVDYNRWEMEESHLGDGKGHGPLHSKFTKEVEKILVNDSKWVNFEKWWKIKTS